MRSTSAILPDQFTTFGSLLKYLRRRAGLTQRELSIAVNYSDTQISRMEQGERVPDQATLAARFVPALHIEEEKEWVARLLALASEAHNANALTRDIAISPTPPHNLSNPTMIKPTRERPTGTVTFLFTDIEGSTQLWEGHPEAMKAAHARHEIILRQAVAAHGGYAYKMIGDAFQVAFATAPEALAAALEAQRALHTEPWAETSPIRVRMALHTGVTEERGDDYVGPVLNRVARLLGVGHGGQVLLTQPTYDLVRDDLPHEVSLRDLGERRLKDLVRPERIFQLIAPGSPSDYPPLKTLDTFPHNLPLQLTTFIGRENEIAEIKLELESHRLVTLTGSGGTGKTRLSLQVAADLLETFPDGVWFVELAPLTDPDPIPQTIHTTMRLIEQPGKNILQMLIDFLREKKVLLILDNCEHLIEACAKLADNILSHAPALKILASSREALGVKGELAWHVPSLSLPDPKKIYELDQLTQYEAVRLFIDRASLANPHFLMTKDNAPAIAQICLHLDGIPLALELAAARVRGLSAEQIASRLDDRFHLLTGGVRTVLPRHQTLQALIDWSHDLLSESERALLRRLSVFAGGWTLEAAELVCAGDSLESEQILDVLLHLIDKSLVVAETQGTEPSYHMLETIRQYAREKLWAAGEGEILRQRHLAYFVDLAERAEPNLRAFDMVMWLDRLEAELDNIRPALSWAQESDVEAQLRLASALLWFWHIRDHKNEGIDWLERGLSIEALERGEKPLWPERAFIRGKALNVAGFLWRMLGGTSKAVEFLEEALALFRGLGPAGKRSSAYALYNLAAVMSDNSQQKALAEESLALFREVGDKFGMAESLMFLEDYAPNLENNYERARTHVKEELALRREIGDKDGIASGLASLADLAIREGDYRQAITLYEESLVGFREVGNKWMAGLILSQGLGKIAQNQGDYGYAAKLHEQALALHRDAGDRRTMASTLTRSAGVALAQGDYGRATQLLEEALPLAREAGNKVVMTVAGYYLGRAAWAQGDYGQATKQLEVTLALGREEQNHLSISAALYGLGQVARSRSDYALAYSLHEEALTLRRELNDPWRIAFSLDALATLATIQHQTESSPLRFDGLQRATRLFGATAAVYDPIRLTRPSIERAEHDKAIAAARAALGEEGFAKVWAEGQAMTLEEAVAYALEEN